jgi:hypothetical protein
MVNLARTKGYELVATTEWNAFFVQASLLPQFGIADNAIERIHDDSTYRMKLFQLLDGTLVLEGCRELLWHGVTVEPRRLQALPRFFRVYVARMRTLRRLAWNLAKQSFF